MTHEKIMAKIWAEIDAAEQSRLKELYDPVADQVESTFLTWSPPDNGVSEIRHIGGYGERHIHGIASTPRPTISATGNKLALQSDGVHAQLPLPLLSEHKCGKPIGEVYYIRRSHSAVYVKAALFETPAADYAWSLIEQGAVTCFSVLASDLPGIGPASYSVVDGYRFMERWQLKELSLVRLGANSDCSFEILRDGEAQNTSSITSQTMKAPSIPYAGVWKKDARYHPGQFVTSGGSLWHAEIESLGVSPGDAPLAWKLAVKRGRAGKLQ